MSQIILSGRMRIPAIIEGVLESHGSDRPIVLDRKIGFMG